MDLNHGINENICARKHVNQREYHCDTVNLIGGN